MLRVDAPFIVFTHKRYVYDYEGTMNIWNTLEKGVCNTVREEGRVAKSFEIISVLNSELAHPTRFLKALIAPLS